MVLKEVKGSVDECIVVSYETEWSMIRFANNEPTQFNNWLEYGAHMYMSKSKRVTTGSLVSGEPRDYVNKALDLIKALDRTPEDPMYVPLTHTGKPGSISGIHDPRVLESRDKFIDLLHESVEASLSEGAVRNAGALSFGVKRTHYVDTGGLELEFSESFISFTIRAFADSDVAATFTSVARSIDQFKPKVAAINAGSLVREARDLSLASIEPGDHDVILSPLVAAHLYGELAREWLSAYSVVSGLSGFSQGDIGNSVASPGLTLLDMSSEGYLLGSEPFDYEGNPTMNLTLIEKGVLRGFLHNNRTAARFGVKSTGHAAGVSGYVFPGPRHISISPGSMSSDPWGLFSELGNGIFILNNWYTRYQNIKEGLFSTVGRDLVLLIRDGRPVARLRGVRIADTFWKLLRGYMDSSKEPHQVYWWDMPIPGSSPYVVVRGLRLSRGPEG